MGQTYVYNLGSYEEDSSENISLEVGLFFDGTANNHRNVEIRKKIEQIEEYADQRKSENRATQEEKGMYNKYGLERSYRTLWFVEEKTDSSYNNDFSNVARMWRGVEQESYGIYIEGIGTEDEKEDDNDGLAFGSGKTGIRAKVRKGCEKLADKIKKKIGNKDINKIQNIYVTIDVFGFSRGAATARNFLYEINGDKSNRPNDRKITKNREVVEINFNPYDTNDFRAIQTREGDVYRDKDGFEVNPAYLDNGKMPKMGYLGYFLLKNKLTQEDLDKIKINIRFVGIYDTVSSYENNVSLISKEAIGHTLKNHLFTNDVEQLQLNNFGRLSKNTKIVHFTAMDEHRANFSLTRIPKGENVIEKEFPGVHSDIGGSYENDYKNTDNQELNPEYITEKTFTSYQEAEKEAKKLVLEHWYEGLGKDLIIHKDLITNLPLHILPIVKYLPDKTYFYYLEGTRKNRKEYSYIPLHFMEEFFTTTSDCGNIILQGMTTQYPIDDDILLQVKNYLTDYVTGDRKEKWEFVSDKELEERKKKKREEIQQNQDTTEDIVIEYITSEQESNDKIEEIEEVILYSNQALLRKLRKEYLHRSAKAGSIAHSPAENRKRKEF